MIPIPSFRLVVAPTDGRLVEHAPGGGHVSPGDVVGTLEGPSGTTTLLAPTRGRFGGALVAPRQAVVAGEALLWLERA